MKAIRPHGNRRKGFTLLELVLAMAIMLIVVPFMFGTFYIINVSHANVTLINDAKDYAALNGRAIENILINAKSVSIGGSGDSVLSFDGDGNMLLNGARAFNYDHYKVKDGTQKWLLDVTFSLDAAHKTINYTILVKDNSKAGKPVKYTLSSSVFLPSAQSDLLVGTTGKSVGFSEPTF